jgi:hypothetical protein
MCSRMLQYNINTRAVDYVIEHFNQFQIYLMQKWDISLVH